MKTRGALLALLVLVVTAVLAPAVAFAHTCPEDESDDCCIPCGARCFCCASAPRMELTTSGADTGPGCVEGRIDAGRLSAPPTPSPRDILHVPRSASPRH